MHLKNPYTHKNEKSEYAGLIFPPHLHPCVLWVINTEMVLKLTATENNEQAVPSSYINQ